MKYVGLLLWGITSLILTIIDMILYVARLSWELRYISWHDWVNGWAQVDSCSDKNPYDTWIRYCKGEFMQDPE